MSLKSVLTALADAIRSKTGGASVMTLAEMADAVNGISTGGVDGLWGQVPAGHGGYIETLSAE